MRKILKFSILLFVIISAVNVVNVKAQNQKIGYIDSDYILSKIPEYKGIQQQLQEMSKKWKAKLQSMQDEIDKMQKQYQAKEILYTPEVKKQKKKEIQNKIDAKKEYLNSKFGPNGEYFQKQKELLQPLQQKVINAVNKVAQREGFDFVFDRSGDYLFLYTRPKWNLSDQVLQQMGIQVNESSN